MLNILPGAISPVTVTERRPVKKKKRKKRKHRDARSSPRLRCRPYRSVHGLSRKRDGFARIDTHLISKSCISCNVRVLATSSSCRMFSSRRLLSVSGCSRIVAAGASSDRDGCCTTIVAWVDRLPPPPALPPWPFMKQFTVRYDPPDFDEGEMRGEETRLRARLVPLISSRSRLVGSRVPHVARLSLRRLSGVLG